MLVQRVLMPDSGVESWTVLGDDHVPVEPVERWLAFLTATERSPNTVKGYAHDLKDWFCYLAGRGLDWRKVRLEKPTPPSAWQAATLSLPSRVTPEVATTPRSFRASMSGSCSGRRRCPPW